MEDDGAFLVPISQKIGSRLPVTLHCFFQCARWVSHIEVPKSPNQRQSHGNDNVAGEPYYTKRVTYEKFKDTNMRHPN